MGPALSDRKPPPLDETRRAEGPLTIRFAAAGARRTCASGPVPADLCYMMGFIGT